jgi:hypothetical protein
MSYRDPQQALDKKYSAITEGLSNIYNTIGTSVKNWAALENKKKAELSKRLSTQVKATDKAFNKVLNDSRSFTGQMKDQEDAEALQSQIQADLQMVRSTLAKQLSNPDLSENEIITIQGNAIKDINSLGQAVITLKSAEEEWRKGKLKAWEEGANLAGKNNDLGLILDEDLVEGIGMQLYNNAFASARQQGTEYQLGSASYSIGNFNRENPITVDLAEVAGTLTDRDPQYFNHLQVPDKKQLDAFQKTLTASQRAGEPGLFTQERFQTDDGKVDIDKIKEYLTNDAQGQNLIKDVFGEMNSLGYLRTKGAGRPDNLGEDFDWLSFDEAASDPSFLVDLMVEDAIVNSQYDPANIYRASATETNTTDPMGDASEYPDSSPTPQISDGLGILPAQGVGDVAGVMQGRTSTTEDAGEEIVEEVTTYSQPKSYSNDKVKEIGKRITDIEKAYGLGVDGLAHDSYGFNTGTAPKNSEEAQERFAKEYGADMVDGLDDEILFQTIDWKFNANRSGKHLLLYAAGKLGDGIEARGNINKNINMTDADMDKLFEENKEEIIKISKDPAFKDKIMQAKMELYLSPKMKKEYSKEKLKKGLKNVWGKRIGYSDEEIDTWISTNFDNIYNENY